MTLLKAFAWVGQTVDRLARSGVDYNHLFLFFFKKKKQGKIQLLNPLFFSAYPFKSRDRSEVLKLYDECLGATCYFSSSSVDRPANL